MPFVESVLLPIPGELGLWTIGEDEQFFRDILSLTDREQKYLDSLKGEKRRVEWLAARALLHQMSGRQYRAVCLKDAYGKPYLVGSDYKISLSHTRMQVAAMAAPREVGVDIQVFVPKIERIQEKFVSPEEMNYLVDSEKLDMLHVIWGAKECLYKAYGRRQLNFRKDISIFPFQYRKWGKTQGRVSASSYDKYFTIHWRKQDDVYLVYAYEDKFM